MFPVALWYRSGALFLTRDTIHALQCVSFISVFHKEMKESASQSLIERASCGTYRAMCVLAHTDFTMFSIRYFTLVLHLRYLAKNVYGSNRKHRRVTQSHAFLLSTKGKITVPTTAGDQSKLKFIAVVTNSMLRILLYRL